MSCINNQYLEASKSQLPYEPIRFVFSETIGVNKIKKCQEEQYEWEYKDILIPKYLNNHNSAFYILFHQSAFYNWLRNNPCREQDLLNEYVVGQSKNNKDLMATLTNLNAHNKFQQIIPSILKDNLQKYCERWEVVKLAFCHKIYIKQTEGSCLHLNKKQMYSLSSTFEPITKSIVCQQVYCKKCEKEISAETVIQKHAPTLCLTAFSELNISITSPNSHKCDYQIVIAFLKQKIYIKAANKIWYEVSLATKQTKIIGISHIPFKTGLYFVYSKKNIESAIFLAPATPIHKEKQIFKKQKITNVMKEEQNESEKLQIVQKKYSIQKKPAIIQKLNLTSQEKQELTELKYIPNKILLSKKDLKKKQYANAIEMLFQKPKMKDQYEVNYDKGKVKKIKQKKHYLQPNYNQIHQQVKELIKNETLSNQKLKFHQKKQLNPKKQSSDDESHEERKPHQNNFKKKKIFKKKNHSDS